MRDARCGAVFPVRTSDDRCSTDTHALIWYLEDSSYLDPAARETFDTCDRSEIVVYVPTICRDELVYSTEKGRISQDLKTQFDTELKASSRGLVLVSLTPSLTCRDPRCPTCRIASSPRRLCT